MKVEYIDGTRIALRTDSGEKAAGLEWALGRHGVSIGAGAVLDDEDHLNLTLRLPLLAGWLSVRVPRAWHETAVEAAKDVGARPLDNITLFDVAYFGGLFWWGFMHPRDSWHSTTPRWRDGTFHLTDALLGKAEFKSQPLRRDEVDVIMPEGPYRWTFTISRDIWTRPRWPRPIVRLRVTACAHEGEQVPIPGKGENAWDCGPNALYERTCALREEDVDKEPAEQVKAAVLDLMAYILAKRYDRIGTYSYTEGGKYHPAKPKEESAPAPTCIDCGWAMFGQCDRHKPGGGRRD